MWHHFDQGRQTPLRVPQAAKVGGSQPQGRIKEARGPGPSNM